MRSNTLLLQHPDIGSKAIDDETRKSFKGRSVSRAPRDPLHFGLLLQRQEQVGLDRDSSVLNRVEMDWGSSQAPVAVVLVAEPAALETGKVVIATDKLQRGLAGEGKIALYGLYFDTAKAEVKPESKPQLAEMAKLLQTNKALKVLIVGHTDNQGPVAANLALSQKRAEAVVAALVTDHKIDAARLRARRRELFAGHQQRLGSRACQEPARGTGGAVAGRPPRLIGAQPVCEYGEIGGTRGTYH